ncbi:hypothetical protein ColLi_13243 [Colletotrichum liriopes]|uniref:Uncharacterized protein n=1 Tax=Colletotrichum liriopes TaxID=708192 RepID=A0AA37H160_9PEZI|nr:hypothetical protein ColLi_13243 [Colletotrichum liriopes]
MVSPAFESPAIGALDRSTSHKAFPQRNNKTQTWCPAQLTDNSDKTETSISAVRQPNSPLPPLPLSEPLREDENKVGAFGNGLGETSQSDTWGKFSCYKSAIQQAKGANLSESPLRLFVPAVDLPQFKVFLDSNNLSPSRFCYENATQVAELEMTESDLHHQCQLALADMLKTAKAKAIRALEEQLRRLQDERGLPVALAATNNDEALLKTVIKNLGRVYNKGTSSIHKPGHSEMQPDVSFCQRVRQSPRYPGIVGEIAYSQTTASVEAKAVRHLAGTRARTDASSRTWLVVIIDIAYPGVETATVSLLAAPQQDGDEDGRGGEPEWVTHRAVFYVAGLAPGHQPEGAIRIFASDFLASHTGLPRDLIRPRGRETAAVPDSARPDQVTITFQDLRDMLLEALYLAGGSSGYESDDEPSRDEQDENNGDN